MMRSQVYLVLIKDGRLALTVGAALEDRLLRDGHRAMALVPVVRGREFADSDYRRQLASAGHAPQVVTLYEDGLLDRLATLGLPAYVGVQHDEEARVARWSNDSGAIMLPVATARDLVDAVADHTPWRRYAAELPSARYPVEAAKIAPVRSRKIASVATVGPLLLGSMSAVAVAASGPGQALAPAAAAPGGHLNAVDVADTQPATASGPVPAVPGSVAAPATGASPANQLVVGIDGSVYLRNPDNSITITSPDGIVSTAPPGTPMPASATAVLGSLYNAVTQANPAAVANAAADGKAAAPLGAAIGGPVLAIPTAIGAAETGPGDLLATAGAYGLGAKGGGALAFGGGATYGYLNGLYQNITMQPDGTFAYTPAAASGTPGSTTGGNGLVNALSDANAAGTSLGGELALGAGTAGTFALAGQGALSGTTQSFLTGAGGAGNITAGGLGLGYTLGAGGSLAQSLYNYLTGGSGTSTGTGSSQPAANQVTIGPDGTSYITNPDNSVTAVTPYGSVINFPAPTTAPATTPGNTTSAAPGAAAAGATTASASPANQMVVGLGGIVYTSNPDGSITGYLPEGGGTVTFPPGSPMPASATAVLGSLADSVIQANPAAVATAGTDAKAAAPLGAAIGGPVLAIPTAIGTAESGPFDPLATAAAYGAGAKGGAALAAGGGAAYGYLNGLYNNITMQPDGTFAYTPAVPGGTPGSAAGGNGLLNALSDANAAGTTLGTEGALLAGTGATFGMAAPGALGGSAAAALKGAGGAGNITAGGLGVGYTVGAGSSLLQSLYHYLTGGSSGQNNQVVVGPDGTVYTIAPDGTVTSVTPDGTVTTTGPGATTGAPGGTAPAAPGGTTPAAPGSSAPAAPGGTTPAAPGDTAPGPSGGSTPGAPDGAAPAAPAPGAPGGDSSAAPAAPAPTGSAPGASGGAPGGSSSAAPDGSASSGSASAAPGGSGSTAPQAQQAPAQADAAPAAPADNPAPQAPAAPAAPPAPAAPVDTAVAPAPAAPIIPVGGISPIGGIPGSSPLGSITAPAPAPAPVATVPSIPSVTTPIDGTLDSTDLGSSDLGTTDLASADLGGGDLGGDAGGDGGGD